MDAEFGFTLDVAASKDNAKCASYFTVEDDGLAQDWPGVVWCNPPYSETALWVEKAVIEAKKGSTIVMLVPASTDVEWFHEHVYGKHEVRFVRGRIKFEGQKDRAPFGSMVVVFRPDGESTGAESGLASQAFCRRPHQTGVNQ